MAYNSFERRLNARKQLRGKDGKWIFMGGSVKWLNKALGALTSGKVTGIDGDYVNIHGNDGQDYKIHRSAISSIPAKATLPSANGSVLAAKSTDKEGIYELRVSNEYTVTPKNLKEGDRVYGGSVTNPNGPPSWTGKSGQSWYSTKTNGEVWEVVSIEDKPSDLNITYKNDKGQQKTVLTPKSPGARLIPENETLNAAIDQNIQTTVTQDEQSMTDVSNWAVTKTNLGGSNGAALYENPDTGETYVVKFPKSDDHARNEVLASRLYAAAGIPMPSSELVTKDGKIGVSTPYIANSKGTLGDNLNNPEFVQNLREGFAVDAWLANWDVAGLNFDNVLADENNEPVRIDPGGALLYRAQGAEKGNAFGSTVGEWESLKTGKQASKVYGDISDEERNKSAELVRDISDDDIKAIVESVGFSPDEEDHLYGTLLLRKEDILEKAGLSDVDVDTEENEAKADLPESTLSARDQMISDALNKTSGSKLTNATAYVKDAKTMGLTSGTSPAYGDIVVTKNAGAYSTSVLVSKIGEEDGVETWSAIPSGISTTKQNSSSDIVQVKLGSNASIFRPYAIGDKALPDPTDTTEAPESEPSMFTPLADPGLSGDGYHKSGPWGKYGASGLMVMDTDTDEFLIVQRGPGSSNHAGKWQLPGGALDSKENIYQGAARESMEELKMPQEYLDSLHHQGDSVFDNNEGWTYSTIAVKTSSFFEPKIDEKETSNFAWVSVSELKEMQKDGDLVPAFAKGLDDSLALFGIEKEDEPAVEPAPKTKMYTMEEIDSVVKDFFFSGSESQVRYFDLEGGSGIIADKADDEQAVIIYPNKNDPSNSISFTKQDIQKNDIFTLIDDALFGSEASDPTRKPRLSTSAVDLDALPEGSVVKFASAPDDKVYLKGADGSWQASWLADDHKQKNVTPEGIHSVAAYLGEDVQIVKDESTPRVEEPEVQDTPKTKELLDASVENLDSLPAGTKVEFISQTGVGPVGSVLGPYTKNENGTWSKNVEDGGLGTKFSSEAMEDALFGYDMKQLPGAVPEETSPELTDVPVTKESLDSYPTGTEITMFDGKNSYGPYTKTDAGTWKTNSSSTQGNTSNTISGVFKGDTMKVTLPAQGGTEGLEDWEKELLGLPTGGDITPDPVQDTTDQSVSTLTDVPVTEENLVGYPSGTEFIVKDGSITFGPYIKNDAGFWNVKGSDYGDINTTSKTMASAFPGDIMTVTLPENADGVSTPQEPVQVAETEPEVDSRSMASQLDSLPAGTKIKFSSGGGVYTKTEDGKIQGLSGSKYPTSEFENDKSFVIVEDEPVAETKHPEKPSITEVIDGINIDENGDQWVEGKDGKPIYVGDVAVSKVGEAGKVTALLKNGKIRVTTAEGDTKFWGKHLVTKGDDSLLVPTGYMYQVKISSNGTEYVTTKSGVDIYVGDTVKAPGKAGFEGKVTGIAPNGQFVLVEDPDTGKIKPRKIDKIEVTASASDTGAVVDVEEVETTVDSSSGVSKVSFEDLLDAPEGATLLITDPDGTDSGKTYEKKGGLWVDTADTSPTPFNISNTAVALAQDADGEDLNVTLTLPETVEAEEVTPDTGTKINVTNSSQLEAAPVGAKMSVLAPGNKTKYYEKKENGWGLSGTASGEIGSDMFQYLLDDKEDYVITLNDENTSNKNLTDVLEVTSTKQLDDADEGAVVSVASVMFPQDLGLAYYKTEKGWSPVGDPSFTIESSNFEKVIEGDGYVVTLTNDASPKKDGDIYKAVEVVEATPESTPTPKPKPEVEELPTDPSSPWFGAEEPVEPKVPSEVSNAKYLPDSWLDEAKKTYLDLKGKEFTSSGYWPQMEGLVLLGDNSLPSTANTGKYGDQEDRFDFFLVRGFITEEQAVEGRKLLAERSAKIKKDLQDYADAKEKYVIELNEWKTANGIPLKGLNPATFKLSGPGEKFQSAEDGETWANKNLPTAVDILTPQEIGAVQAWTSVGGDNGYQPDIPWKSFSVALRSGKQKVYEDINTLGDPKMIDMAKNIDSAIAKSEVTETFTVIRNADMMNFITPDGGAVSSHAQMLGLVDSIVTDYGFIASSASNAPGYGGGNVSLEITVPRGANALWLSGKNTIGKGKNALGAQAEYEVLLPRGTRLYIHQVSTGSYGKTLVKAEIVPDNWTPPVGVTSGPVVEADAVPQGPVSSVDESITV